MREYRGVYLARDHLVDEVDELCALAGVERSTAPIKYPLTASEAQIVMLTELLGGALEAVSLLFDRIEMSDTQASSAKGKSRPPARAAA